MCAKNYQMWFRRFKNNRKNVRWCQKCLDHGVYVATDIAPVTSAELQLPYSYSWAGAILYAYIVAAGTALENVDC